MKKMELLISVYEELSRSEVDWKSVKETLSKFLISNK